MSIRPLPACPDPARPDPALREPACREGGAVPLERAGPHQAGLLAGIHAVAFAPEVGWPEAALVTLLELPGVFGVLAGSDGFVLARVVADEAEILTFAVRPERRRRGLGGRLLAAAEAAAAAAGAASMFLEVGEANRAARCLYAAAGYQPVGRRRAYYADGGDALVLRRALQAAAADGADR
jgi:ribosomal-protein-alanine N-acetyltransferase